MLCQDCLIQNMLILFTSTLNILLHILLSTLDKL